MTQQHDFKAALDGYFRGKLNRDLSTWLRCYESEIQAALEIAAEQKTVDVDDLFHTIVNAIDAKINKCLDATHQYIVKDTLNHLAAQGYLRTPDTEKDRVLELMADVLEMYADGELHGNMPALQALSEYEKLKGGA